MLIWPVDANGTRQSECLGLNFKTVLAVCGIFFAAGFVKGVLGFGLPLFTMSFLPFFVPVEVAIVLSALVQPITNIGQLISSGGVRNAVVVSVPVLLALLPGVAIGAWFLTSIDSQTLLFILGVAVIAFSVFNLSGYKIHIQQSWKFPSGIIAGGLAGLIGALTSINGPIYIMYLAGYRPKSSGVSFYHRITVLRIWHADQFQFLGRWYNISKSFPAFDNDIATCVRWDVGRQHHGHTHSGGFVPETDPVCLNYYWYYFYCPQFFLKPVLINLNCLPDVLQRYFRPGRRKKSDAIRRHLALP